MKRLVNDMLGSFGIQIKRIKKPDGAVSTRKAEGFPEWLRQADAAGMDVNDYINSKMGSPVSTLEMFFFPYLREFSEPSVCEIGIGTGRWSRDIAAEMKKCTAWKLYLVDHSPWIVEFLMKYFSDEPNIVPLLNDGSLIPIAENETLDIAFSNGTFIEFSLQRIYSFSSEFKRLIRKGGYAIFNYIDIDTKVGYEHLKGQALKPYSCFTYHSVSTVNRIFEENGFEPVRREVLGNSTYAVYRKK